MTLEEPGKIGHEFRAEPPPSFVEAGWPISWSVRVLRDGRRDVLVPRPQRRGGGARGERGASGRGLAGAGAGRRRRARAATRRARSAWPSRAGATRSTPPPTAGGGGYPPRGRHEPGAAAGRRSTPRRRRSPRCAPSTALTGDPGWGRRLDALRAPPLRAPGRDDGDRGRGRVAARWASPVCGRRPSPRATGRRAPAPSSAGSCGPTPSTIPRPTAERLCAPDVLTDFGLRTLAATDPNFRPDAYHRGSVWPFDSWLGWGRPARGRVRGRGRARARRRAGRARPARLAARALRGQRGRRGADRVLQRRPGVDGRRALGTSNMRVRRNSTRYGPSIASGRCRRPSLMPSTHRPPTSRSAIEALANGIERGDNGPDAARRDRHRQDHHDGRDDRASAAPRRW